VSQVIGFGLDLSHHQSPGALPWASWRGKVDFVIARAGYGSARDRHVSEHVARARDIGAKVGLYLFFRPSEPIEPQLDTLLDVAEAVALGPGDIVPALDIEQDPIPSPTPVAPSWSERCLKLVEAIEARFGGALVYITQREWSMLGKPEWVLKRPLWCAHYRDAAPATPGNVPATIHQHRVGAFDPHGPGGYTAPKDMPHGAIQLDQNRLFLPLPLIPSAVTDQDRERVPGLVAETIARELREDADTDPAPPPSGHPV